MGLGMNAQCTLIYDLPEGHNWTTFRALCGYDSSCDSDNPNTSGTTMEFIFYVTKNEAYTFDLTQLGYDTTESVTVHDIWAGKDLGTVTGTISTSVPSHGVKLFRLGEKATTGIKEFDNSQIYNLPLKSDAVYDLSGRPVSATSHLPKGMYISNGKKVMK